MHFAHGVYLWILFDSQNKPIISFNNTNQLILVEMYCGFFDEETELNFRLQRVNDISVVQ